MLIRFRARPLAGLALLVALPACDRRSSTPPRSAGTATEARVATRTTSPPASADLNRDPEPGWKEFAIPGVGASVLMPVGGPARQKEPVPNQYSSEKDGVAYLAFGGKNASEFNVVVFTPRTEVGQTVDQALDVYVEKRVNGIPKGKVVEGAKMAGLPARGYVTLDFDGKPVSENRLVAVGNKWVILRVQGPAAAPAEIKTFFDSFKLTGGR